MSQASGNGIVNNRTLVALCVRSHHDTGKSVLTQQDFFPIFGIKTIVFFYLQQVDLRKDITGLGDVITELSHDLNTENDKREQARDFLATTHTLLSSQLEAWKNELVRRVEEHYREYQMRLDSAYNAEHLRLNKGHERIKKAQEKSEKLLGISTHLKRTGNPRDLKELKDNMEENVDTLNLLLDQRTQLKSTTAETWKFTKPSLAPESFQYLMGQLNIQTVDPLVADVRGAVSGAIITAESDAHGSSQASGSDVGASLDNLLGRVESARMKNESARINDKYMLLHSFSSKTYNDKARCHPMSFTLDWMGNIVVADKYNNKVKIFTERGQLVQEITSEYLKSPSGVAMTPEGNIAVSDTRMHDVKVFDSRGDLLFYYERAMTPGGIAFNHKGDLLVADTGMRAVLVYDTRNWSQPRRILRDVTPPGLSGLARRNSMFCPHYVAVNNRDEIYISDRTANCLHVLDKNGFPLKGFGSPYTADLLKRFNEPYGVTVDRTGNVLVAGYGTNTIVTIGTDDQFKAPILTEKDDLKFPTNVQVSPVGKLLVSEYLSGAIKVFGTQEIVSMVEEEENAELPPAYDSLGGGSLLLPATGNPTSAPPLPSAFQPDPGTGPTASAPPPDPALLPPETTL